MQQQNTLDGALSVICQKCQDDPENLVFLTGAGISISSGIPLWEPIKQQVYSDIFDMADTGEVDKILMRKFQDTEFMQENVLPEWNQEDLKNLCSQLGDKKKHPSPPPEVVFAFFRQNYGDLALGDQLRRLFERCLPSPAYAAIARILAGGFSRYYLTANQDGSIEACLMSHLPHWRVVTLTSDEDFAVYNQAGGDKKKIPESHHDLSRIVVANLHGSFTRPETLQITPESLLELKGEPTARHRFMEYALKRAHVLVIIGYKGNDTDIVEPLKSILTAPDCCISDVIAVRSSDCLPKLGLDKRKRKVYNLGEKVDDADKFLTGLYKKLDGETLPLRRGQPFRRSTETETRVTARGSVILAGDYGVFANGLMVQLLLPLRATVERLSTKQPSDVCEHYDPRTGTSDLDKKTEKQALEIREFLQAFREGRCPEKVKERRDIVAPRIKSLLSEMPKDVKDELARIDDYGFRVYSEYPSGSGAGDGLPAAILCAALLPKGEDLDIGSADMPSRTFLVKLCMLWYWIYTYHNFSYTIILATCVLCAASVGMVSLSS